MAVHVPEHQCRQSNRAIESLATQATDGIVVESSADVILERLVCVHQRAHESNIAAQQSPTSAESMEKKVISGFSIVRNIALGADLCNAARAMMLALGCIQALKCNTLKCPTGVATLDPKLMNGLVVSDKTVRVQRYQEKTVHSAVEIMAAAGVSTPGELSRRIVTLRQDGHHCATYEKMFPSCEPGSLLDGSALPELQNIWEDGGRLLSAKPGGLRIEI